MGHPALILVLASFVYRVMSKGLRLGIRQSSRQARLSLAIPIRGTFTACHNAKNLLGSPA